MTTARSTAAPTTIPVLTGCCAAPAPVSPIRRSPGNPSLRRSRMRAASCGDPVRSSGAPDSSGAVAASPVVHQGAEREEYAGAQCAHEPSSVGSVDTKLALIQTTLWRGGIGGSGARRLRASPSNTGTSSSLTSSRSTLVVVTRDVRPRHDHRGMRQNFIACDREQALLLPPGSAGVVAGGPLRVFHNWSGPPGDQTSWISAKLVIPIRCATCSVWGLATFGVTEQRSRRRRSCWRRLGRRALGPSHSRPTGRT